MSIPPSKQILTVSALRPARTSPRSHHLQPPRPLQRHSPRPLRLPVPHHVSPRILRPGQHNNLRRHRRHRQPNRLHAATDTVLNAGTVTIITVEARHDAFFRSTAGQVANPAPFVRHSLGARLSYTVTSDTLPRTPAYPANGPSTSPCPS
jgi:hypothetical protein